MPIGNGAAGVVGSPLPKWQLALAVGAPVALGLGYMYYRNIAKSDRGSAKDSAKANGTSGDKQISIDGECPTKPSKVSEPQTPSEQAQKYKNLGNTVFKAGKYDEAIAYYNKAIETCPEENKSDLATFYQNRAAAYEQLKKYSAVKDDCTMALELKPRYAKALLRRARAMERMNQLELVLEDVTAACILEQFQNQSTLQMADRVLKQLGKQHAQEHLEKKVPLIPSKHFIKTYFRSFRRDPYAPIKSEAFSGRYDENRGLDKATLALGQERYEDVISICTEEITLFKNRETAATMQLHLLRATFYIFLGQYDAAMVDLETAITHDKSSNAVKINALINRASLHMQFENQEKCFQDYKTAVEIDPDCSDIYHHRGQMNILLERIDEAKQDAEKAIKLNPNFDVGYAQKCYTDYRYAVTKRSGELVKVAMANFEKAFKKFPNCSECYTLYAQVLTDSQDYEKADKNFAKAISKDSGNATIYVHRALLQLQWQGDIPKAVSYIRQALQVDNKSGFAYETLATIEVQRGHLREAIELFDKAVALGRSAVELSHLFSLKDAAKAQLTVTERLGSDLMWMPQGMS